MKYIKVECDKCNKEFKLSPKTPKKKIIDGIRIEYFICKHCREVYIYLCKDDYIESKQKAYKSLEIKIKALTDKFIKDNSQELLKEITILRNSKLQCLKDMKNHSDILIGKVKGKI